MSSFSLCFQIQRYYNVLCVRMRSLVCRIYPILLGIVSIIPQDQWMRFNYTLRHPLLCICVCGLLLVC